MVQKPKICQFMHFSTKPVLCTVGFFQNLLFFSINIPNPELSEGSDLGPELTIQGRLA